MPNILRTRLALVVLLGAFLIPIGTSSLRGLTHVVTCDEQAETPFTLQIADDGTPLIVSSQVIERDAAEGLCGGLLLNLAAETVGEDRIALVIPITNNTGADWRGTVRLQLGNLNIPVDIGHIGAGGTATDRVVFDLPAGSHDLTGSLLIGP